MMKRWTGPWELSGMISDSVVEIKVKEKKYKAYVARVLKYVPFELTKAPSVLREAVEALDEENKIVGDEIMLLSEEKVRVLAKKWKDPKKARKRKREEQKREKRFLLKHIYNLRERLSITKEEPEPYYESTKQMKERIADLSTYLERIMEFNDFYDRIMIERDYKEVPVYKMKLRSEIVEGYPNFESYMREYKNQCSIKAPMPSIVETELKEWTWGDEKLLGLKPIEKEPERLDYPCNFNRLRDEPRSEYIPILSRRDSSSRVITPSWKLRGGLYVCECMNRNE
jgi:hypothetical protein